jgi:hypothetical protein
MLAARIVAARNRRDPSVLLEPQVNCCHEKIGLIIDGFVQ